MNRAMNKAKKNIISQKKKYVFLAVIMLIGLISGIIFMFFISKADKSLITKQLESFFSSVKNGEVNYFSSFINSLSSNYLYMFLIWVLGISIIGIPIILFMIFFKSFILGFSMSSITANYGFKGVFMGFAYNLPHQIGLFLIWLLISFFAIGFSIKLFKVLFFKENINLSYYFKRYLKILGISSIGVVVCSLIETFFVPFLLKLLV